MTRGPAKQFDRDEVLDRAMQLFWTQGYEATGLSQLLEHMGIARQSLYNTFGDKKSLYLEALRRYFDGRQALAHEVLTADGSPLANLRRLFEKIIEVTVETDHCGCFMGNSVAEFGRRDADMEAALQTFFGRMRELFTETLQRAQAAGELAPEAPTADIAEMFIVTFQGLALLDKVDPDRERAVRILNLALAMLSGGAPASSAELRTAGSPHATAGLR